MTVDTKACAMCGGVQPLDDFHRQPTGPKGRHSYCKACYNERYVKTRTPATPEVRKRWNLARRYGLTPKQYDDLVESQGGVCAICEGKMERPCVDHDHKTGDVRGVLCHGCNLLVGALEKKHRDQAMRYLGLI